MSLNGLRNVRECYVYDAEIQKEEKYSLQSIYKFRSAVTRKELMAKMTFSHTC